MSSTELPTSSGAPAPTQRSGEPAVPGDEPTVPAEELSFHDGTDAGEVASAAWFAMYRIWSSEESTRKALDAADAEQLTSQQFAALLSLPLDTARGLRMRQLAQRCHSTPSYITSVVDTLESRGLAVRRPDPGDRRVTEVRLTDDGLRAVGRCHAALAVPPSGMLELSEDELRTLRDLLERAAAPYPWPT